MSALRQGVGRRVLANVGASCRGPVIIAVLPALIFAALAPTGLAAYGANDDWALASLLSGAYSGVTETSVPFLGPLFIAVVHLLYDWLPLVAWYGLALGFLGTGSIVVALFAVRRSLAALAGASVNASLAALAAGATLWFALAPTFTATSVLLVVSAVFSAAAAATATNRSTFVGWAATGAFTAAVGVSVRPDTALLAALILAPIAVAVPIVARPGARRVVPLSLGVVGAALALSVALNGAVDSQVRHDPTWPAFAASNELRGQINGTPRNALLFTVAPSLGWAPGQATLLSAFAQPDLESLSASTLAPAVRETAAAGGIGGALRARPRDVLATMWSPLRTVQWLAALCCAAAITVLIARVGRPDAQRAVWGSLCLTVYAGALLYLTAAIARLPERFAVPTIWAVTVALVAMALGAIGAASDSQKRTTWVAAILASVVLAGVFLPGGASDVVRVHRGADSYRRGQEADLSTHYSRERVIAAAGILAHPQDPYAAASATSVRPSTLDLGWVSGSPGWRRRATLMGLDPDDLITPLAAGQHTVFVGDASMASALRQFIAARCGTSTLRATQAAPMVWRFALRAPERCMRRHRDGSPATP